MPFVILSIYNRLDANACSHGANLDPLAAGMEEEERITTTERSS